MQGKIQIAAPDDAHFGKKASADAPPHSTLLPPEVRSQCRLAHLYAPHQRTTPAHGNSPFWETDRVQSRTVKAALYKRLPVFHYLSARQCGTRHSLLSAVIDAFCLSVYGYANAFQVVWHESLNSITKSDFFTVPVLDRYDII